MGTVVRCYSTFAESRCKLLTRSTRRPATVRQHSSVTLLEVLSDPPGLWSPLPGRPSKGQDGLRRDDGGTPLERRPRLGKQFKSGNKSFFRRRIFPDLERCRVHVFAHRPQLKLITRCGPTPPGCRSRPSYGRCRYRLYIL